MVIDLNTEDVESTSGEDLNVDLTADETTVVSPVVESKIVGSSVALDSEKSKVDWITDEYVWSEKKWLESFICGSCILRRFFPKKVALKILLTHFLRGKIL